MIRIFCTGAEEQGEVQEYGHAEADGYAYASPYADPYRGGGVCLAMRCTVTSVSGNQTEQLSIFFSRVAARSNRISVEAPEPHAIQHHCTCGPQRYTGACTCAFTKLSCDPLLRQPLPRSVRPNTIAVRSATSSSATGSYLTHQRQSMSRRIVGPHGGSSKPSRTLRLLFTGRRQKSSTKKSSRCTNKLTPRQNQGTPPRTLRHTPRRTTAPRSRIIW